MADAGSVEEWTPESLAIIGQSVVGSPRPRYRQALNRRIAHWRRTQDRIESFFLRNESKRGVAWVPLEIGSRAPAGVVIWFRRLGFFAAPRWKVITRQQVLYVTLTRRRDYGWLDGYAWKKWTKEDTDLWNRFLNIPSLWREPSLKDMYGTREKIPVSWATPRKVSHAGCRASSPLRPR